MGIIEMAGYGAGEDSPKRAGEDGGRVEDCKAFPEFGLFVPAAEEVEDAGKEAGFNAAVEVLDRIEKWWRIGLTDPRTKRKPMSAPKLLLKLITAHNAL